MKDRFLDQIHSELGRKLDVQIGEYIMEYGHRPEVIIIPDELYFNFIQNAEGFQLNVDNFSSPILRYRGIDVKTTSQILIMEG